MNDAVKITDHVEMPRKGEGTKGFIEKRVSQLVAGDEVQLANGIVRRVTSIGNGFYERSKLIHFTGGDWTCQLNGDTVFIKDSAAAGAF